MLRGRDNGHCLQRARKIRATMICLHDSSEVIALTQALFLLWLALTIFQHTLKFQQ